MLKRSRANVGHILRAKNKAFNSFLLLSFIQQIFPEYLLHARFVFGTVDLIVNKIGRLSASRACSQVGQ